MPLEDLLLVPLGLAAAAYGAAIGTGGGFVLAPALLLLFPDRTAEQVTAVNLTVVFMSVASGSLAYARQGRIDYLTGVLFGLAALPTALVGVLAVRAVPRPQFDVMFGVLLLMLAVVMLRGRPASTIRQPLRGRGVLRRTVVTREGETYRYSYRAWQGLSISAAVGFLSSLFGLGGGVMHVPAMIVLLRFPAHVAVATSTLIVVFMAAAALGLHLSAAELSGDPGREALVLGVSAVVGAQAGARLSRRFASETITRLLVAALAVIGLRLVARAFF